METRMLVGCMSALFAFAAAYAVAFLAGLAARRKSAAMAAQGDAVSVGGLVAWRLRNGFSLTLPVSRLLLKRDKVHAFAEELSFMCEQRGQAASPESVMSVIVVAACALALAIWCATKSVIGGFASALCAVCVLAVFVGNSRDKRREAIREQVPDAIDSMAACFGSGFTLLQTFKQVAEDTHGPLSKTFSRCSHMLEMGGSANQALSELREGAHASELAFVAVALDVQHQSGGAMKQVLDAATDTVKGELALRRALRVQTAQAKLSARVVVVMPFILVAAFSLATPDFLAPFFSSPLGYGMLALAIVMQVAGIMLVRRALAVDGVS